MSRSFTIDVHQIALDLIHEMNLPYPELVGNLTKLSAHLPISRTYLDIELAACEETGGGAFGLNFARLEELCALITELLMFSECELSESHFGRCILIAHTMKQQGLLKTKTKPSLGTGYFFEQRRAIQTAAATWDTRILRRK